MRCGRIWRFSTMPRSGGNAGRARSSSRNTGASTPSAQECRGETTPEKQRPGADVTPPTWRGASRLPRRRAAVPELFAAVSTFEKVTRAVGTRRHSRARPIEQERVLPGAGAGWHEARLPLRRLSLQSDHGLSPIAVRHRRNQPLPGDRRSSYGVERRQSGIRHLLVLPVGG